ncbi:hypothetical protein MYSTI_01513 [Myxococcus stipitatus DSM 14675]|uniref:Uncharacterized protein n=2 Tax=Myxococcus stipitatus TaxID=83455 RepID=L7U3U0_MYXSD|nr:hypothetical protein MYSTI_01513 [Myxococcus stipitatus DSM 14675]
MTKKAHRLTPLQSVQIQLAYLSGNQCAFPGCTNLMMDLAGNFIGQVCHIEAAEYGGERHNDKMSNEDRRSFENLMVMCYEHHRITNDVEQYPAARLRRIKEDHERRFAGPEREDLERRFALAAQSFNEDNYLQRHCLPPPACVELTAQPTTIPPNVDSRPLVEPIRSGSDDSGAKNESHAVSLTQMLMTVAIGKTILVVGDGGSGKSTTLKMALAAAAERRRNDRSAPLPILLALSRFRGDLNALINESLGIAQGDWRTLPGTFLVFCDGLNELPLDEMASFGDALETPQRRDRVALVVSVRGGGVRGRTQLPSIDRVLRLSPLNKAQMIKMAQQALGMEDALGLLDHLRDRMPSRRLNFARLPFGFVAMLDEFRDKKVLPVTDAAVMEAFLRKRLLRAREAPKELAFIGDLADELLVGLAVGIALELRLNKHLSSMRRPDVQSVLTSVLRKAQQDGLFGADAITSVQAFAWMRHAELLILSADDWVSFRHDLIADYFAALALAKDWERYVGVLRRTYVTDDAWLLRVSRSELNAWRRSSVFAASCPGCAVSLCLGEASQGLVIDAARDAAERGNELAMLEAISVMRTIGNEDSLDWLRECAVGIDRKQLMDSRVGFNLLRALAYLGDESVLGWLLEDSSHGALQIWQYANPERALALSREYLARNGECEFARMNLCLDTLVQYGDSRDVLLLSKIIQGLPNPYLVVHAFRALFGIEPTLALGCLRPRYMESPDDLGIYLRAIAETGTPLDSRMLIQFVFFGFHDVKPGKKTDAEYHIDIKTREPAAKFLELCQIDSADVDLLLAGYELHPRSRHFVWSIAQAHQLAAFDRLAIQAVLSGGAAELGSVVEFARVRSWGPAIRNEFDRGLLHRVETDSTLMRMTFSCYRVLRYLAEHGNGALAASVVTDRVAQLGAAYEKISVNESVSLPWGDPESDFHLKIVSDVSVEWEFAALLPIASAVADLLPEDTIRIWLRVDTSRFSGGEQQLQSIYGRLRGDELDEKLCSFENEVSAAHFLLVLVELGITRRRVDAFSRLLVFGMWDLRVCFALLKVLPILWRNDADEVARIVVDVVARSPISQFQLHAEFVDEVLGRMTRRIAERVVGPALVAARDPLSREILQLWYDKGMRLRSVD